MGGVDTAVIQAGEPILDERSRQHRLSSSLVLGRLLSPLVPDLVLTLGGGFRFFRVSLLDHDRGGGWDDGPLGLSFDIGFGSGSFGGDGSRGRRRGDGSRVGDGDASVVLELVSLEARVDLADPGDAGDTTHADDGRTVDPDRSALQGLLTSATRFEVGLGVDAFPTCRLADAGLADLVTFGTPLSLDVTLLRETRSASGGTGDTVGATDLGTGARTGKGTGIARAGNSAGSVDTSRGLGVQLKPGTRESVRPIEQ